MEGTTRARRKGLRNGDTTFSTMTLFREGDPGGEGWQGSFSEEGLDSADVLVYITTSAFVIRIRGNW